MPIATTSDAPEHFDLKSLPGAFVIIRRMNHGERMTRQSLLNKAKMSGKRGRKDFDLEIDVVNDRVTLWEWQNLIVDHNLEYLENSNDPESVRKLDFKNPEHVRRVDGKVAEEVNQYLNDTNNFDDEDTDQGNS
jgi:hypothetical protein